MRHAVLILAAFGLAGCIGPRGAWSEATKGPDLAPMEDPRALYAHQPVLMPDPGPAHVAPQTPNSLWQAGASSFFEDPRARDVGDILTVLIDIEDTASVSNSTDRTRQSSESAGINGFLGLENSLGAAFPAGFNPAALVDVDADSASNGAGTIDRSESINLTVAAQVTQVLPNGNLVLAGRQEVRVNQEVRELTVTGLVRPQDITAGNTIQHTQIAEARISYGGRGVVSDVQAPRYGQRIWTKAAPF